MTESHMKAALRPAAAGDWPDVQALLMAEYLPVAGAHEHLSDFLIATDVGLVGCVGLERYGDAGLLRSLAVSAAHRGKGIGNALVDACVAQAENTGVRTIVLLTETAEKYFERRGFVRVDRVSVPDSVRESAEFRGACPDSAIAMVRRI